jgi:hypothetical protein
MVGDIPIAIPDEHQPARVSLPSASHHEIEDALLPTKETAPGPDAVPITAIRRAWPHMGLHGFQMVPRARLASNSLPRGNPGNYPKTREGPRQEQSSFIPAYCLTVREVNEELNYY